MSAFAHAILLQAHLLVFVDLGIMRSQKTSYKEINTPIPFTQTRVF